MNLRDVGIEARRFDFIANLIKFGHGFLTIIELMIFGNVTRKRWLGWIAGGAKRIPVFTSPS